MKQIALTKGKYAIVDDEDFEWLNQWKWFWVNGKKGYAMRWHSRRGGKQRLLLMHRLIMNFPEKQVDHVNGNSLDNRRGNLRLATHQQNSFNRMLAKNNIKSGHTGVTWHKGSKKWYSRIKFNGKMIHLGCFNELEEAIRAREAKQKELFGIFSNI